MKSPTLLLISALVLVLAAVLLFARLGHYAVWDDEAMIALAAKGVIRTGDTSVQPDDHNLLAYPQWLAVAQSAGPVNPPFSAYLAMTFHMSCSVKTPLRAVSVSTVRPGNEWR